VVSAYPPGYDGDGAAAAVPGAAPATDLEAAGFDADGMLRVAGRRAGVVRTWTWALRGFEEGV
jgi:hypothetical protein